MNGFDVVEGKAPEIESLCSRYAVEMLWLFGSALTEAWDPATSDYDFAVKFGPTPPGMGSFDQYLRFKDSLAAVLARPVDLVEWDAIQNPFFMRHLERTRKTVFAA